MIKKRKLFPYKLLSCTIIIFFFLLVDRVQEEVSIIKGINLYLITKVTESEQWQASFHGPPPIIEGLLVGKGSTTLA